MDHNETANVNRPITSEMPESVISIPSKKSPELNASLVNSIKYLKRS